MRKANMQIGTKRANANISLHTLSRTLLINPDKQTNNLAAIMVSSHVAKLETCNHLTSITIFESASIESCRQAYRHAARAPIARTRVSPRLVAVLLLIWKPSWHTATNERSQPRRQTGRQTNRQSDDKLWLEWELSWCRSWCCCCCCRLFGLS